MTWLIWKDYRLNRVIVIANVMFLVMPHALMLVLAWYGLGPSRGGAHQWSQGLMMSGYFSVALSQLTLALLGGHLIACERVDRSAEFLAYLPLSRARILASKLTVALLIAVLIWGPNLLILKLATAQLPQRVMYGGPSLATVLGYVAVTGFVFFCVGWLFSSMLESPTFAILIGLITPFVIIMGVQALIWALEYAPDEIVGPWYQRTCLALAPTCLVVGTLYYLRRVEP